MPMIEIRAGPAVQLSGLLDQVAASEELDWSVLEIWAVAQDEGTDVVRLEKQAAESPDGLTMSGAQLRELADRLAQFIDGVVAGYRGTPPARSAADLRDAAEIVIEAIDSTLWRVYARDQEIIDRLRREYDHVRDVVPEVPIPAAHEDS